MFSYLSYFGIIMRRLSIVEKLKVKKEEYNH